MRPQTPKSSAVGCLSAIGREDAALPTLQHSQLELPQNYQLLYTSTDIQEGVARVAIEVNRWLEGARSRSETPIVGMPLLNGGVYMYTDLSRQLSSSLEMMPLEVSAYQLTEHAASLESVQFDFGELNIQGRHLLLVDDVCDSGRSLSELQEGLLAQGAAEVKSAVLIRRLVAEEIFMPDWIGFEYDGPEWFVGYGMDDQGFGRNLRDIYIMLRGEAGHE